MLHLAHGGWRRQSFGYGFATPLVREPQDRTMAGILGLSTVASRFAATPHRSDDRTRTHVFKIGNRAQQIGATGFQAGEGLGHRNSFLEVVYTSRISPTIRASQESPTFMSRTRWSGAQRHPPAFLVYLQESFASRPETCGQTGYPAWCSC